MRPPESFGTERLTLRVPRASDAQAIYEGYARDAEVVRYLTWHPHENAGETEQFLAACARGWAAGDDFPWAVTLKPGGELIGMMGLRLRGFKAERVQVRDEYGFAVSNRLATRRHCRAPVR